MTVKDFYTGRIIRHFLTGDIRKTVTYLQMTSKVPADQDKIGSYEVALILYTLTQKELIRVLDFIPKDKEGIDLVEGLAAIIETPGELIKVRLVEVGDGWARIFYEDNLESRFGEIPEVGTAIVLHRAFLMGLLFDLIQPDGVHGFALDDPSGRAAFDEANIGITADELDDFFPEDGDDQKTTDSDLNNLKNLLQ